MRLPLSLAIAVAVVSGITAGRQDPSTSQDPLAAEISHWSTYLSSHPASSEEWLQIKQAADPALQDAALASRSGRRLFALQRLAAARQSLAANAYVESQPASEKSGFGEFEATWKREGLDLSGALGPASADHFSGIGQAAIRGIAQASSMQVRVYYDASLDYGRNTMPESGLYYLGIARAQAELVALCRRLGGARGNRAAPPLRSIVPELDRLQSDVLRAYHPPASIDEHREFIALSATIKEARELDAAGLREGALLRYLQAVLRFALVPGARQDQRPELIDQRFREMARQVSAGQEDHSLAALFVEQAEAEGARAPGDATSRATRDAIITEVLPRYFDALRPASPQPAKPSPQATVTLVRWPYT